MTQLLSPSRCIDLATGPLADYCVGHGYAGFSGEGGVAVLKLSTTLTSQIPDREVEESTARDWAETRRDAESRTDNVKSFSASWRSGLVWGYDVARHDDLDDTTVGPLMKHQRRDGSWVPVYSAAPLLEAATALFGSAGARRFALVPGSHSLGVAKDVVAKGPLEIWSALALAIPENPRESANLIVDVVGTGAESEARREQKSLSHGFHRVNDILDRALLCGDEQGVQFKEIFIAYKSQWVPEGRVGRALAGVPNVALARNAVPPSPADMLTMSLSEWESFVAPELSTRTTRDRESA